MPLEFFGEVSIYFGVGVQVVTALILGGVVGYDREKKMKSAGIKTNMLICLGATLYTTIGLLVSVGASGMADPTRIAAQIVSGIGFLGAGAIIQGRGNVIGMTTAAIIWTVAAIGFTIGAGYPLTASIFTLTVIVVLKMINPIYRYLENKDPYDFFELEILSNGSVRRTVMGMVQNEGISIEEVYEEQYQGKKGKKLLTLYMIAHERHMKRVFEEVRSILKVQKAAYHSVAEKVIQEEGEKKIKEREKENSDSGLTMNNNMKKDKIRIKV